MTTEGIAIVLAALLVWGAFRAFLWVCKVIAQAEMAEYNRFQRRGGRRY